VPAPARLAHEVAAFLVPHLLGLNEHAVQIEYDRDYHRRNPT
jgi:hypothetical protein